MAVKRFRTKNRKQRSLRKQRSQRKVSRRNTKGGRKLTRKKSKRRNVRKGKKSTRKKSQRGGARRVDKSKKSELRAPFFSPYTRKPPKKKHRTEDGDNQWPSMTTLLGQLHQYLEITYVENNIVIKNFTYVCFMILVVLMLYNSGNGVDIERLLDNFNSLANQAGINLFPIKDNIFNILTEFFNLGNNIGWGINWFINSSGSFSQYVLEQTVIVMSQPFINAFYAFWDTNQTVAITGGIVSFPTLIQGLIKYSPPLIKAINNSRKQFTHTINARGGVLVTQLDGIFNGIIKVMLPAMKTGSTCALKILSSPVTTPLLYILEMVTYINNQLHVGVEQLLIKSYESDKQDGKCVLTRKDSQEIQDIAKQIVENKNTKQVASELAPPEYESRSSPLPSPSAPPFLFSHPGSELLRESTNSNASEYLSLPNS